MMDKIGKDHSDSEGYHIRSSLWIVGEAVKRQANGEPVSSWEVTNKEWSCDESEIARICLESWLF